MDHPALETLFSSSPGTKQDADRKFFYTAFITSEPANLTMPDTADPAETLGLIKGLAEVVKSQHSAHKAEQEAHLKAMKATNEHIRNLTATAEGLSKQIPKSTATNNQGLRLPNLLLPEYTGKQPLERFINQMESLLRSSGVPLNSGPHTLNSNAKRTAGLTMPLLKLNFDLQQLWVQTPVKQPRTNTKSTMNSVLKL